MAIGSYKNIITANVIQLHNNIPEILSKINIILIINLFLLRLTIPSY